MHFLSDIRALIIDMDGVLWHGDRPQAGLAEFFQALRDLNLKFILATNNASMTAEQYVTKLAGMGVAVELHEILTSGMATAHYLSRQYQPEATRIFVIGGIGATQPLLDKGFTLTGAFDAEPDTHAHLVVSGLDRALTWDKLVGAALNIQAGAEFFATNGDVTLPSEKGLLPGNGATLAALQAATGVVPVVIGKPEPVIYQQAMALLGEEPGATIAIGDRLDTDILGAVRAGIRSLMVLSGVSSLDDIEGVDYQPTWIMADIQEITCALRRA